jgi:putative spermidine/putrescine transport system permease protein
MKKYIPLLVFSPFVLPFIVGTVYSLLKSIGFLDPIGSLTYLHWKKILVSPTTYITIAYSIYIALVSTVISFILALTLLFHKPSKANLLVLLPLTLPPISVGFIFFQLLSGHGFFARLFTKLPIFNSLFSADLSTQSTHGFAIIMALTFMTIPVFYAFLRKIFAEERVGDQIQISRELGASRWHSIRKIALPLLIQRSQFLILLYFVFALSSYEIPLLLGSQSPKMITVYIIDKIQKFDLATIPEGFGLMIIYSFLIILIGRWLFQNPK